MAKLTLNDVTTGYQSTAAVNANNALIEAALENTISRDGTAPNTMTGSLDMNGNNILNQGNPISIVGWEWEGPWVTSTAYTVGDVIETGGSTYICIVAHTSGTFSTDLAAVKWQLVATANLPTQTSHNGKYLTTNGSSASWEDASTIYLKLTGGTLSGTIKSTSGEFNLKTSTSLSDGDATLTAAQLVKGLFTITPTTNRTLTTQTASQILTELVGDEDGSHFEFTIVNTAAFNVTLVGGTGVTIKGSAIVRKGSMTFRITRTSASAVECWRLDGTVGSATSTYEGAVELATTSEAATGTDTAKAVTPAGLSPLSSIGTGQTWTDVTSSRLAATTYTNTTGRPIQVLFSCVTGTATIYGTIAGVSTIIGVGAGSYYNASTFSVIVPNGITYAISSFGAGSQKWLELR